MRAAAICVLSLSIGVQAQSNCSSSVSFADVHCACVQDPNSQVCALLKKGFYDGKMTVTPPKSGWLINNNNPRRATPTPAPQPVRPRQARVVPLPSKEYLRFLQPNAFLAAGFDFGKMLKLPGLMEAILGAGEESGDSRILAALGEIDHLWMSVGGPNDIVLLMTGKFENGKAAGLFYSQGIMPVFLGDAHAMMIGPEPSIQAALARMGRAAANDGWVTRRARELAKDHETWMVTEPPRNPSKGNDPPAMLETIRRFALGIRISGETSLEGEAIADSEAHAQKIAAWVDQIKQLLREKTGVGALDALNVRLEGPALRFAAKDDGLVTGDAGQVAMSSDFGVELYQLLMAGVPGTPLRTVAQDRIQAVNSGMKREEVLSLLGPPLSISAIQGLDVPKETWYYQVPFGKQYRIRLEDGVVVQTPF